MASGICLATGVDCTSISPNRDVVTKINYIATFQIPINGVSINNI